MIFEIGDIIIFQNNRKRNNFDISTLLSESDKKENIYAIMEGRQIILCKTKHNLKQPRRYWIPCKLSVSGMLLSHRDWKSFIMQRPKNHQVTFRLSREGAELREEILRSGQLFNSTRVESIDSFCLIKDIKIWNDPELWEELYNSKEFCLWDTFPFNADGKIERNKELCNLENEINYICDYLKNKINSSDEKIMNDFGDGNIEDYVRYWINFYKEHGAGPEKKFFKYKSIHDVKKIPRCYLRFFRVKTGKDANTKDIVKNFDERFERIQLMIDKSWKRVDCEIKKVMKDFKLKQPDIISEKLACRDLENREPSMFINPKDIRERIKKFNN